MWKGLETIRALLRECISHQVQLRLNNGALWAGEQINVMCIAYHEQSQILHLTDILNTLGIHNGHKSRGGRLGAFSSVLVLQKGKLSSKLNDLDHISIQPTQKLYE